jgi:hypothetical protein
MFQMKWDDETDGYFASALKAAVEARPSLHHHVVLYDMGLYYHLKGDLAKALECYRQVLPLLTSDTRYCVAREQSDWAGNVRKKIADIVAGKAFPVDANGRPIIMESRVIAPGQVALRRSIIALCSS